MDLQVAIERCSLQAEPLGRVTLHAVVLESAVKLFVAHLGEQRGGADVGDLHVLQVSLEYERDLRGALCRRDRPSHGEPLALRRTRPASAPVCFVPSMNGWPLTRVHL